MKKVKLLLDQKNNKKQPTNPTQSQQQTQPQHQPQFNNKPNMFEGLTTFDNQSQEQTTTNEPTTTTTTNQKKKKNKKNKPTKQQTIDEILKEVGFNVKEEDNTQQPNNHNQWEEILTINDRKFNYEKQLRRHFKGWQQDLKEDDPEIPKKHHKMQKHLRQAMKKSILSPGVKDYFPINEKFQVYVENGLMKFVPTKKYDMYQVEYQALRNTNDINALFMFTQTHPQHTDSLYAVGEFLRLQGNYRQADSLIQRVIYIYEMGGGYQLGDFIKKDIVQKKLIYDIYSTSFFMSLFKFMDILGKKGCFKAALQYNKFLLKLNLDDPTACLLSFDFNAISAKQFEYLVDFVRDYPKYLSNYESQDQKSNKNQKIQHKQLNEYNIYCLPNFSYSIALAKFMLLIDHLQITKVIQQNSVLQELLSFTAQHWNKAIKIDSISNFTSQCPQVLIIRAIMLYPKLILDIALKNQYTKQYLNYPKFEGNQKKSFDQILKHQFWNLAPDSYSYHFLRLDSLNDSKGLDKILEIYVERSKILWKGNDIMLWMKGALGFVLNQIEATKFNYQQFLQLLCTNQNTHFMIPFLLRRYENVYKGNFSDRTQRIDLNNIQDNHGVRPQRQRSNLSGNPLSVFLQTLLPWVNIPNADDDDRDMPIIEDD